MIDLTKEESPVVNGTSIETWRGVDSEVLSKDEKGVQNEAPYQVNVHMESHLSKNIPHFVCPPSIVTMHYLRFFILNIILYHMIFF